MTTRSAEPVDQQARDIISGPADLHRTLFVEAGAGSGKTRALVDRIVQLVLTDDDAQRCRLASIAAITFTEAAASELRERIRIRFEARLRDAREAGDVITETRCLEALDDADVAAVSTLHAFAQRLLSEYPVEVGIPPRVEVVDEVQSQIEFDDRWSAFIDGLFDDVDLEALIVRSALLGVGIGDKRSQFRQLAQVFDDNWDRLVDLPERSMRPRSVDWIPLLDAIENFVDQADDCVDPTDHLLARMHSIELRTLREGTEHDRVRGLEVVTKWKFGRCGRKASWRSDIAEIRELGEVIVERAASIRAELVNETIRLLADRIARFTVTSAQARRAEGRLEFHDLLVLARQLLRDSVEARRALSSRYRVLMLDEFQDTDPIQTELAFWLTDVVTDETAENRDAGALQPAEGRLFMVGDPKQSIYRFRRADIDLFLRTRNQFEDGRLELVTNFRTVPEVIDFVNAFFARLMPTETPTQPAYTALVAHRQGDVDHRPVVFGSGVEGPAGETRAAEADSVAALIADIRAAPERWRVTDPATGDWRLPRLADIAILLPTRTSLPQLTAALDRHGLAHKADTGTLVYETQEVRDVVAAMHAIDDASDQIHLVAALRSPLYGCTDADLVRWREIGGAFDHRSGVPPEGADSPVAEAMEHLASLAADRWWREPSQLVQQLIDDRLALAIAAADTRPRDTWRRLRYVVDQARAFAEAGGGDLRAWLRWVQLQGADGSRAHEPMLPEPDDDAVRILTIHGSKGLEFPITIVSGLTTRTDAARPGLAVRWVEEAELPEVSFTSSTRTDRFDAFDDLEAQMDHEEKRRLLYVGLTRARDHLLVSAFHPLTARGEPFSSHGADVAAFADSLDPGERLVRRVAGSDGDGRTNLEGLHGIPEERPPVQPSLFDDVAPIDTSPSQRTLDVRETPPQDSAIHALADGLLPTVSIDRFDRDRDAIVRAAGGPPAFSATTIAARGHQPDRDDDEPQDDYDDTAEALPPQTFRRGRAGTAIGTAVHDVLQHIDLRAPETSDIASLARAAAWNESVPGEVRTIEASVRAALDSPTVAQCRTARHWKECYVAAPVDGLTIEGYVDLLVEADDGLVVVDYKTDAVSNAADIDAKLARYALQGAAYAVAVERSTGRSVVAVEFVFAAASGAIVRRIEDLATSMARVREAVAELHSSP